MNLPNLSRKLSVAPQLILIAILAALPVCATKGIFNVYNNSIFWFLAILVFLIFWISVIYLVHRILPLHNEKKNLVVILIIGALIRSFWLLTARDGLTSDFASYHELAAAVASGQGYAITGPSGLNDMEVYLKKHPPLPYRTAFRPPGAPLWGGLLYRLFGIDPIFFKISNLFMGLAISFFIYLLLRNSPLGSLSLLAAFLYAACPSAFMATNLVGTEILFSFMILLVCTILAWPKMKDKLFLPMAIAGIAGAGAVMVRSMLWPFGLSVLFAFLFYEGGKEAIKKFSLFIVFLCLFLAPWTIRNWIVFKRFIPVATIEGRFFAHHSTGVVPDKFKTPHWTSSYEAWENITDEAEKAVEGYKLGKENMKLMLKGGVGHIFQCAAKGIQSLFETDVEIFFWARQGTFFSGGSIFQLNALISAFYLLCVFTSFIGVLSFRMDIRQFSAGFGLFAFTFVFFVSAHLFLLGTGRYHFAMMPFLLVMSARGLQAIFDRDFLSIWPFSKLRQSTSRWDPKNKPE